MSTINILMDLPAGQAYHSATVRGLEQAAASRGLAERVDLRVVPTATIDRALTEEPGDGVVVGPGSPYDSPEKVLDVIRTARERGVPLVGT